jgi:inorganic pyrophosphatase
MEKLAADLVGRRVAVIAVPGSPPGSIGDSGLRGAREAYWRDRGGAEKKGESWTRNDRLIAVATHAQTHDKAQKLSDLRPHLLDEIKEFFVTYNKLRDRKFRATHEASPQKARKLIDEGMKTFKKKRRKAA